MADNVNDVPTESMELPFEESKRMTEEDREDVVDRSRTGRKDHFAGLIHEQLATRRYSALKLTEMERRHGFKGLLRSSLASSLTGADSTEGGMAALHASVQAKRKAAVDERVMQMITGKMVSKDDIYSFPVEVRIKDLTYTAYVNPGDAKIKDVYNSSFIYTLGQLFQSLIGRGGEASQKTTEKDILHKINLILKPGTQYLILGAPGSGKSSLLKAIAGRLQWTDNTETRKGLTLKGCVEYNGKQMGADSEFHSSQYHICNAVAYIDQLDVHAPRYTVEETFEFAYQCKTGGIPPHKSMEENLQESGNPDAVREPVRIAGNHTRVTVGLEALGLAGVKDTFVGDATVRGVSGGQRRRVTVGEMIMDRTPILCGDEISTGLDAASTYDMIDLMTYYGRVQDMTRIIALLQPSPETVSLFDEVIVLAEGKILYAGPIESVQGYFEGLGYKPPAEMDVADFLQVLSTPDAAALWTNPESEEDTNRTDAYSVDELADKFANKSQFSANIMKELNSHHKYVWDVTQQRSATTDGHGDTGSIPIFLSNWRAIKQKYANSFPRAVWLNLKRSLVLWVRDRRVLIANGVKNAVMGVSVGGVFYQTEDVVSILGVLFQSMLFIMLGASTSAPALVDDRVVFRKHYEANFFSAYPFVVGRAISQMPQILMDVLVFGSILYFMVGLHLSFTNYAIFIAILFTFSVLINQIMAVFAAAAPTKASVQVMSAIILLLCILFGGFIVPPNVIPVYYEWIYWWNPFAWAYRALLLLEFYSDSWSDPETILATVGFIGPDGKPFEREWLGYWFAYMGGHYVVCVFATAWCLGKAANTSGSSAMTSNEKGILATKNELKSSEAGRSAIPFVPATLSFEDICYDVQASKGSESLRLLNNVCGVFQAGRMCALMGSSGAGKTPLMDVIAMRKSSGTVSGEVLINGFPQEKVSFRRASGYVEQFDVQAAELTVFETILYSARLRLDQDQVKSDVEKVNFVKALMKTLELSAFADALVGTSESGGLSFEQKKRLSIAVELAASPSIIFLDEPTSGLDARSALLVVKLLRKIATEGRTICATIHQPSSAVFEMFDDLLLLKKGGNVVYFGELGDHSHSLVTYFEERGARSIDRGENPANWVLSAMTSGSQDFAEEYLQSKQYEEVKESLATLKENPISEKKIHYDTKHACPRSERYNLTSNRLMKIYWRSPNYNLSRMTVAAVIALIMGSVLIPDRQEGDFTETQMRAQFATMFLSFIILGIMSIFSVLPVMLSIRDMFHRHQTAGMLGSGSLAWALGYAEKGFILVTSTIFCAVFLFLSFTTTHQSVRGGIAFWGFFTFNIALYSYFGQAFVCFFKPMATAQILASVFIGLNNFFSGLIVRPQFMTGLFAITYWITPGHYVYEGMITAMFSGDDRTVVADFNTDFYDGIECASRNLTAPGECTGTVDEFMNTFFGGKFDKEHIIRNYLILGAYLFVARFVTFLALNNINFSTT